MAKVNIDLEKLICQLIENACISTKRVNEYAITEALKDQGIEYKDGSLHYIGEKEVEKSEPVNFEDFPREEQLKWYICTKSIPQKGGGFMPLFCEGEHAPIKKIFSMCPELRNDTTLFTEHFRKVTEDDLSKKPDTIKFEEEPFKIKKGNWYMCIKDYHKDNDPTKKELSFKKGCIYDSFSDSSIRTIQGYGELFNPKTLIEHFRPAREDEFSCYEPRFCKGDILTDGEKFYKVLDWDYNENNVAFYKLDYGILKGNWLAYDADQNLTLTTRLELPETTTKFKKENQQTLEEISKKGYVDMGRPIEITIQKEPNFYGMVYEYIKSKEEAGITGKELTAYRKGLEDMYKRLKG